MDKTEIVIDHAPEPECGKPALDYDDTQGFASDTQLAQTVSTTLLSCCSEVIVLGLVCAACCRLA